MTFKEFNKFQADLYVEVLKIKDTKGKEYANSTDRFANFNRLSNRLDISNLQVAWIYLVKHLDAIESYIKTGKTFSTESIRSRFIDAITYLFLIAGIVEENERKTHIGHE
jgi:hypothetical protein